MSNIQNRDSMTSGAQTARDKVQEQVPKSQESVFSPAGSDPTITGKSESVFSSAGGIGKQFNPDGNIGQIGEKVGGPFSKEGAIGSQFDASKDGIAGTVEKMVGGPSQGKK